MTVASIKFYLRENLMHPGEPSSANQRAYDESHLARLHLIRALIDVGGLSVASARDVLAAVDEESMPLTWAFGMAQKAIPDSVAATDVIAGGPGDVEVDAILQRTGWQLEPDNPGVRLVAQVVETWVGLGRHALLALIPEYTRAAEIIARADLAAVASEHDRADRVQTVVVGTVMGDVLLAGLRRMAQEQVSNEVFPAPVAGSDNSTTGGVEDD